LTKAAFSHENLAVNTLSKIFSTIQDSANAVSANTFLGRENVTVHVVLSNYLWNSGQLYM